MAKLQGYVRSVSINPKKISEGSHVYWDGCPSKVKLWYVREVNPNGNTLISPDIISPRGQTPHVEELKTLVIEYCVDGREVKVGDIATSLCYGHRGNMPPHRITSIDETSFYFKNKQPLCYKSTCSMLFWRMIPLKYTQWEYAVKNG